ncbi:MAG: hypothetical protein J5525_06915 [Lachnospiraceae bacterium]|nr:hypothetical protein [Lachnospiraceae bacterium]
MTAEDIEFLNTIQEYADKVMPDIDPQKVQISEQLQKLRPILQELAMKHKMTVEDTFIKYMDLATERAVNYENKMNDEFEGVFAQPKMPKY